MKKVYLVCDEGVAVSRLLLKQCKLYFPNEQIGTVFTTEQFKSVEDIAQVDVVITTNDDLDSRFPILRVNPILEAEDILKIYDKNFVGGLILQARVTEQVISFSNPNNNTLTFSNYVKLDSKISDVLRNRMAEMIESRLPYTLKMSTSTGTSFKNGTGESIVTPELYKGQKKITDATYRYYFGSEMTTGQTYKVLASRIENKQVLTVAAYIGNNEVARDELTFVNVNDGQNGVKGDKGERGEKGTIDEEKLKEIEQNINSKADNTLTQEQLNALNEKNSIMQAELEAKASLDTVNQWFKAYQDFVKSNAADKAKSEKDLIAATQRVAKIENNLGDMAQRWNFIDTYMQATNEGLSIGKSRKKKLHVPEFGN